MSTRRRNYEYDDDESQVANAILAGPPNVNQNRGKLHLTSPIKTFSTENIHPIKLSR